MSPSKYMPSHSSDPTIQQKPNFDVMEFLKAVIKSPANYHKFNDNSVLFCDIKRRNHLQLIPVNLPKEYEGHFRQHWPSLDSIHLDITTTLGARIMSKILVRVYKGSFQLSVISPRNRYIGSRYIFEEKFSDIQAQEMHELLELCFYHSRHPEYAHRDHNFGDLAFTPYQAQQILPIEIRRNSTNE